MMAAERRRNACFRPHFFPHIPQARPQQRPFPHAIRPLNSPDGRGGPLSIISSSRHPANLSRDQTRRISAPESPDDTHFAIEVPRIRICTMTIGRAYSDDTPCSCPPNLQTQALAILASSSQPPMPSQWLSFVTATAPWILLSSGPLLRSWDCASNHLRLMVYLRTSQVVQMISCNESFAFP